MRAIRQTRRAQRGLAFARQLPTLPVKNGAPPQDVRDLQHITGLHHITMVRNGIMGRRMLQCELPESH